MSVKILYADAPAVKSNEVLSYVDDAPARYVRDLNAAETLAQLRESLTRWPVLAADAIEQADAMTADQWDEFQIGLRAERKGRFAGEEWARKYGAILMPGAMIQPSLVAAEFKVPFGLAYIRLWEAGR